MAQFNINDLEYLDNNKTIFEANMLADNLGVNISPAVSSRVEELNSTTAPLDVNESFIGEWVDVSKYQSVTVAIQTDREGEFAAQFSSDGVNLESNLKRYYRTTFIEAPHRFTITRKYFRVVFTNTNGTAQSFLRLQCILGDKEQLNVPLDAKIAQDYDSVSVRTTNFKNEVSLGLRDGVEAWHKWGYNLNVGNTTPEVVASFGGNFTPLFSPDTLDISSTDINDTDGGTGATTIRLYGLDENREERIEDFTLDGTNIVTSTSLWLGVNKVSIISAGSNRKNHGNINVVTTVGGFIQAQVPAGIGGTEHAFFFVKKNHKFLLDWYYINVVRPTGMLYPIVKIRAYVLNFDTNVETEVYNTTIDTNIMSVDKNSLEVPFPIQENSLLYFTAVGDIDGAEVHVRFSGMNFRDADALPSLSVELENLFISGILQGEGTLQATSILGVQ